MDSNAANMDQDQSVLFRCSLIRVYTFAAITIQIWSTKALVSLQGRHADYLFLPLR